MVMGGVIVTLEEVQDRDVTQGMGGVVKIVGNWKTLLVAYRAQMLYKTVSESTLGLTNVKEATSGPVDTLDQVDGCAGEHLSDMKGSRGEVSGQ
eukprot:g28838.t1